jgi:hypothetical protein
MFEELTYWLFRNDMSKGKTPYEIHEEHGDFVMPLSLNSASNMLCDYKNTLTIDLLFKPDFLLAIDANVCLIKDELINNMNGGPKDFFDEVYFSQFRWWILHYIRLESVISAFKLANVRKIVTYCGSHWTPHYDSTIVSDIDIVGNISRHLNIDYEVRDIANCKK